MPLDYEDEVEEDEEGIEHSEVGDAKVVQLGMAIFFDRLAQTDITLPPWVKSGRRR